MCFKKFIYILSFFFICQYSFGGELVLTGVYRGANLYIQNPHDGSNNYCITDIYINNKKIPSVPKSTAFNLDLSSLQENEPIVIKIYHNDNCIPKVLNPNAIRTRNEFQFASLDVNDDHLLWTTKGEKRYGKYFIMKYEHNNWVIEKAIDCKGSAGNNSYEFPARHHSGVNKYKVKYLDVTGRVYYSPEIEHKSAVDKVEFYPRKVSTHIRFTRAVKYEILDAYGKVIKSGLGDRVECGDLKGGRVYYVSFDNKTESFFKK